MFTSKIQFLLVFMVLVFLTFHVLIPGKQNVKYIPKKNLSSVFVYKNDIEIFSTLLNRYSANCDRRSKDRSGIAKSYTMVCIENPRK